MKETHFTPKKLLFTLLVCLMLTTPSTKAYQCTNERGQNVSWFIAFRIAPLVTPRLYAISDSRSPTKFRLTTEFELLNSLFSQVNPKLDSVIAWNDAPPGVEDPSQSFAHSKGFIALQNNKK